MTIQIIKTTIIPDFDTGEPAARSAEIIIDDNGTLYFWTVGGLPLTGALQPIFDSREAELLAAAIAAGARTPNQGEIELASARQWFVDNPGSASAIFGGTVGDVDSNIQIIVNALPLTAQQKTGLRYALMAGVIACRTYANVEGLV